MQRCRLVERFVEGSRDVLTHHAARECARTRASGSFKASCRFPSENGDDLNLFLTNDVKGGIKDSIGSYFATKKSFQKIYGQATPVKGAGKEAYTAFDGSSSLPQGSILVLDGKNHAVLMVFTGNGVTADNVIEHGKAVAALVLPKLK